MATPGYREYAVDPRIAAHVVCAWSSTGDTGDAAYRVLPDGCIDLLWNRHDASLTIVGAMTRAIWVRPANEHTFVGIRFRPGGAVPFVREDAGSFTDEAIQAADMLGRRARTWADRLAAVSDPRVTAELMVSFLVDAAADASAVDARIECAASQLTADPGRSIAALGASLGVSRQHLRRLFTRHTGLTPKVFARIARLQRLVPRLSPSLAEAAASAGYSDQAHMTREFRQLVGCTPRQYLAPTVSRRP